MDEHEHVFFLMPHHVVWDGWSFDIFLRDFDAFYSATIAGSEPHVPALPIQYIDFANWHRIWLERGNVQKHLPFWKQNLSEIRAATNRISDRSSAPTQIQPSRRLGRIHHYRQHAGPGCATRVAPSRYADRTSVV